MVQGSLPRRWADAPTSMCACSQPGPRLTQAVFTSPERVRTVLRVMTSEATRTPALARCSRLRLNEQPAVSAGKAARLKEGPLLLVHLLGQLLKPRKSVRPHRQGIASASIQVGAERDPDWPVESLLRMARILDVANELLHSDIGADLVQRDPVDGLGQRLSKSDGSARETPQIGTRTTDPTG